MCDVERQRIAAAWGRLSRGHPGPVCRRPVRTKHEASAVRPVHAVPERLLDRNGDGVSNHLPPFLRSLPIPPFSPQWRRHMRGRRIALENQPYTRDYNSNRAGSHKFALKPGQVFPRRLRRAATKIRRKATTCRMNDRHRTYHVRAHGRFRGKKGTSEAHHVRRATAAILQQ